MQARTRLLHRARLFVLTTLLLGIVGSPALLAAAGSPRGGYGYDEGHRVKQIAHELENVAERVYHDAKRYGHHGKHGRSYLRALDNLAECAEDYERAVRRHRGLRDTHDDFRGLVKAYREADYALNQSRNRSAREGLYRVGSLLEALNAEYTRSSRGRNHYDRGSYDNRRYDDRRDRGRYEDDWRGRRGGRGGRATISLPRIVIDLPF